jgi:hypothetical protein
MTASAVVMAVTGLACSFAPHEIAATAGGADTAFVPLLIQLCGALYLSFAMANWMSRNSLIGGIYARPLAMGNFLHFTMGALALVRQVRVAPPALVGLLIVYAAFAVAFGAILFSSPVGPEKK